jgi:hypothetical protein
MHVRPFPFALSKEDKMTKQQIRRLKRLEAMAQYPWRNWLRNFAREQHWNEKQVLRAVQGHESELTEGMRPDGAITGDAYVRLGDLLKAAGLPPAKFSNLVTWEMWQKVYNKVTEEAAAVRDAAEPAAGGTRPPGDQR